jgi:hypothetical protein
MIAKIKSRESGIVVAAKRARRATGYTVTVLPPEEVGTISMPVRETLRRLPSRHWKKSLEKNLIEEGLTPAKARKLVELAAS